MLAPWFTRGSGTAESGVSVAWRVHWWLQILGGNAQVLTQAHQATGRRGGRGGGSRRYRRRPRARRETTARDRKRPGADFSPIHRTMKVVAIATTAAAAGTTVATNEASQTAPFSATMSASSPLRGRLASLMRSRRRMLRLRTPSTNE